MLTADVQLQGFDTEDWRRLLTSLSPPQPQGRAPAEGLIALRGPFGLEKLLHTRLGRLEVLPSLPFSARALAQQYHVRWAVVLERYTLEQLAEQVAKRVKRGDDLLDQTLLIWTVARELARLGHIDTYPLALRSIPIPSRLWVLGALQWLCPTGKSLAFGLWQGEKLYTALVLHRGNSLFDALRGPEAFRAQLEATPGNWQIKQRLFSELVQQQLGPLSLCVHASAPRWEQLMQSERGADWTAALRASELMVSPAPPEYAIPLGLALTRLGLGLVRLMMGQAGLTAGLGAGLGLQKGGESVWETLTDGALWGGMRRLLALAGRKPASTDRNTD